MHGFQNPVDSKDHFQHNTHMMKTNNTIRMQVPRQRTRAHVVLFCEGTPFKPKRVESKKAYARRPKHVKTLVD
jgi:hypothetical protein